MKQNGLPYCARRRPKASREKAATPIKTSVDGSGTGAVMEPQLLTGERAILVNAPVVRFSDPKSTSPVLPFVHAVAYKVPDGPNASENPLLSLYGAP